MDGRLCHETLLKFSGVDHATLLDRLRGIRDEVEAGHLTEAAQELAGWRRDLARHLDWEERALLPALTCHGTDDDDRVAEDHVSEHRELLVLAADVSELVRTERGAGRWDEAVHRLDTIARRLERHRDAELYGVCSRLDAALDPHAIRQLERARDER